MTGSTLPFDDKGQSDPPRSPLDPEEFRRFYDRAYPQIYAYLFARCGRAPETARDLIQETFFSVISSLRNGAQPDDLVPWAMSIAKRRLVDYYRREGKTRKTYEVALRDDEGAYPQWTSELEVWLESAMARLPAKQRAAVVLRHMDGLGVDDVAKVLGLSYRATESVLARARSRLARELAGRRGT